MTDSYERFLSFDWSDERWRTYLNGLYPPPSQDQIAKFKRKWYKRHVDSSFDDSYDPSAGATQSFPTEEVPSLPEGIYEDGSRWGAIGQKATICFTVYCVAILMSVGSAAGVFPAYQSLVILVAAFLLELIAKYGIKFKKDYFHHLILDDVGIMPIMSVTLLMPGLNSSVRVFAMASPFLTALMSFAQICKFHKKLPSMVCDFWAPLASSKARRKLMQVRADLEVALGFSMVGGVLIMACAPITTVLFWNFMMMRYMMSPWTQASFKRLDGHLSSVLESVPGIKQAYQWVRSWLFSYVDPQSKSAGKLCTIL